MEHRSHEADIDVSEISSSKGNQRTLKPGADVAQRELLEEQQMGRALNCSDSELCTFLQALEEGFLPTYYSDTSPSVQSKSMSIASRSYRAGRKTVVFHGFPSLEMSRPSTDDLGADVLTSYLAAFPARTSVQQEKARALPASDPASGQSLHASFAKYDPDSCTWKTPQYSLLGGLESFSETWPRQGSMRNGECLALPTLELLTSETESGLWQTPVADDACSRKNGKFNSRGEPKLSAQVMFPTPVTVDGGSYFNRSPSPNAALRPTLGAMAKHGLWPTPTVHGNNQAPKAGTARGTGLSTAVKRWPTPTAGSTHSGGTMQEWGGSQNWVRKDMPEFATGQLSPTFVEWLMGWPSGWTDLKPLEMAKFHEWQQQHSLNYPSNLTESAA